MDYKLINGECIEELKKLPDKSIDLFICDLPYMDIKGKAETNCAWNVSSPINLDEFWEQFKRVRKSKRSACIHFCSTKFGYALINSAPKLYKMDLVWRKRNKTGGLSSRYRPMRSHEMIYFFYEQAPKYNRDKYHKRIKPLPPKLKKTTIKEEIADPTLDQYGCVKKPDFPEIGLRYKGDKNNSSSYVPPNPNSVVEEYSDDYKAKYSEEFLKNKLDGAGVNSINDIYTKENLNEYIKNNPGFTPPNPDSIIERKSIKDRKGVDINNVYTKENLNKYIKNNPGFTPPNPNSIVEEGERVDKNGKSPHGWDIKNMDGAREPHFTPPLPDSIVFTASQLQYMENHGLTPDDVERMSSGSTIGDRLYAKSDTLISKKFGKIGPKWDPALPDTLIPCEYIGEEIGSKCDDPTKKDTDWGYDHSHTTMNSFKDRKNNFNPPNPDSVIEELNEAQLKAKEWGWSKTVKSFDENTDARNGKRIGPLYTPPNPDSVVQGDDWGYANYEGSKKIGDKRFNPCLPDSILCGDDEDYEIFDWLNDTDEPPSSIVASKKAFIGKRNHQTEKPTDVIRFFLKYWSDEGDTIFDPTMGSGSTGVACKELKRNFIGIEFDKTIYGRAVKRVEETIEGDCLEAIDCPIAITATEPKKPKKIKKKSKGKS